MKKNFGKILLAGEGGQGIQTMAKIISKFLVLEGFYVSYIPQFGPEQRGTPSVAFIQFSETKIAYPKYEKADLLILLRRRAINQISSYIDKNTEIVFDSSTIKRKLINQDNAKIFGLPATQIAKEHFSSSILNIIVLGMVLRKYFDCKQNKLWQLIEEVLAKKFEKNKELKELNLKVLDYAYNLEFDQRKFLQAVYDTEEKIIVKKNRNKTAVIIPRFCKGCGICILKCPEKALKFGETLGVFGTPTPDIDLSKCIACGNCFRFCPDSAIKVKKN